MGDGLYEDPVFPASLESIYYDGRRDPGIKWMRPKVCCLCVCVFTFHTHTGVEDEGINSGMVDNDRNITLFTN